ncbi:MAG: LytTR family DNA-binding domain-containing protein [Saprospiraceae bacterium]|nr:LytTR family DNA-binding domain-containing protein [Saprospiraceae bacterium]MCF8252625.1 LytTR family DNA-binding domain-containing protein [Saprospiraceae bacterium]MCF8283114.1 LytTR family DNA-binding domain-containing protein [Bacteroidales bacterium]MCF8314204.1 LytTR family DNA-binding domain-containing protein [Saprospiraceae bacterium]MCF8443004.1 LytTR family DNA-binding domain-containing protein [Saprospiraceae bacterium]
MKTYLLDDESNCTDVLQVLLGKYCPDVQIKGIFNDPELALEAILRERPDLLFLDIEMPMLNGFELLRRCESLEFKVIFTTAYDQYAVKAFKFNALDYLLKPVDKDELIAAVGKAKLNASPTAAQLSSVQYLRNNPTPERIALPVGQELLLVEVIDIQYVESEGSYVSVFLKGQNKPVVLSKSLREFEELLNNPAFFRAHNSYLIHLKHIKKIMRTDAGEVVMENGRSLPVARAKKAELMGLIAKV